VQMEVARAIYERMGFVRSPEYDLTVAPPLVVMAYVAYVLKLAQA
jgi:hypothetical protein